jgi:PAS domain S-box-containing protein
MREPPQPASPPANTVAPADFHDLPELIHDALLVVALDGTILSWNRGSCALFGWTDAEAIGQNSHLLLRTEFPRPLAELEEKLLAAGEWEGTLRHTSRQGDRVDTASRWILRRDASGAPGRILHIGRDITQRLRTEEALLASEAQLRLVIDGMPGLVSYIDAGLHYRFANKVYGEWFGRPTTEVVGMSVPEVLGEQAFRRVQPYMQRALAGESVTYEAFLPYRGSTGRYIRASYVPDFGINGKPRGFVVLVEDISARRAAEHALQESEQRFRHMADHAPVMIWVSDTTGRCIYLNRSWYEFTGQTPDTAMGFGWLDAVHPEDRQAAENVFLEANSQGREFRLEYRLRRSDGEWRWALDAAAPRLAEDGAFLGYIGTVLDITERRQAEEILRDREDQLRTLADSIPQLAWMAHPDGYIFWYNRRWYEYTGTTAQDMEGWGWQSVHHREMLPRVLELWRSSIATGEPFDMEFPLRGADGRFRWFLTRIAPLRSSSGEIVRWFGTNTDIESLRQAREALRESEQRFRTMADAAPVLIWTAGADRLCNYVNRPWLSFTGREFSREAGDGWLERVHRDDVERVHHLYSASFDERQPFVVEYRLERSDGAWRWMLMHGVPRWSAEGSFAGYIGSAIDLTERKAAEEHLRESEERYRVTTEAASDGIITIDDRHSILFANRAAARLLGYDRDEIAGRPVTMLMPGYAEAVTTGPVPEAALQPLELIGIHRSGEEILLELSLGQYVVNGRPMTTGVFRDIGARKRLEQQLQHTAKLESLGLLAGGIAHDFNNLLTGILGGSTLVLDSMSPSDPNRELLGEIVRAGEHAAKLTTQLLAYAGKGKFVVEPVSLTALVKDVAELIKRSVPKHVSLELRLRPDLPAVEADRAQMQQLIMNLVINGAEAVPEGKRGVVVVTTRLGEVRPEDMAGFRVCTVEPGPCVVFQVRDNGAGMDEDTINRIFDPFFTTKFTGRGLGLSAVQGIVQGHRGALQVSSVPGEGTTFDVYFPALASTLASEAAPGRPASLIGAGVILVADDEATVRQAARATLEHYGYTVIVADDGAEALRRMQENPDRISLVLLDLTMPVMNGVTTLREMERLGLRVPVLLTSGYNEAEATQHFAGVDLAGFIQKPYTARALADAVKRVLDPGAAR